MAKVGRPHFLDTPGNIEAVALAWVEGKTRKEMAAEFGFSTPATATRWTRDPRVKAKAAEYAKDRILRVVRRTDSEIEVRLQNVSELTVKDILDIRKEYVHGPGFESEEAGITPEAVNQITEAIETNPEFAKDLEELLKQATPASTEGE